MITYWEHEEQAAERWRQIQEGTTGIACPNCGYELRETVPGIVLTCNPPRKAVRCFNCNWSGTVAA